MGDQSFNQLLQNVPNPFSQSTTIGYVLNTEASGSRSINSLDGKLVKKYDLSAKGQGNVLINASDLSAGTYTYTIYVITMWLTRKSWSSLETNNLSFLITWSAVPKGVALFYFNYCNGTLIASITDYGETT